MKHKFEVLDSFRGLFALSVVLFHMNVSGSITELDFFRGSSIFVDFFFVLSGFVLTYSYSLKKELIFKDYFISRTFRLLPLHIVMLVIFIFFELGKYYAYRKGFEFNNIPFTGARSLKEIVPNLLLLQSWFQKADHLSFNFPSWSISIEYYIYMIFF